MARGGVGAATSTDISHLAQRLDNTIDAEKKAASRMVVYRLGGRNNSIVRFSQLIGECVGCVGKSFDIINSMPSEGDAAAARLARQRRNASVYENDADEPLRKCLDEAARLHSAVEFVKLKDVYETLEQVTDRCVDALDVMNDMVLKYKYGVHGRGWH